VVGRLHVGFEHESDVGDVETDEKQRIQQADTPAKRDEEGPRRRKKEERDFGRDIAVQRHRVVQEPVTVDDCPIPGLGGPPDGKDGDAGPTDADEDTVRAGHVRDGEVRVVAGPGQPRLSRPDLGRTQLATGLCRRAAGPSVPGVQRIDGVLRGDS